MLRNSRNSLRNVTFPNLLDAQNLRASDKNFRFLTTFKEEKLLTLRMLCSVEKLISCGSSDDFERYSKMGLRIAPDDTYFLERNWD